jgi:hypothetical protein
LAVSPTKVTVRFELVADADGADPLRQVVGPDRSRR